MSESGAVSDRNPKRTFQVINAVSSGRYRDCLKLRMKEDSTAEAAEEFSRGTWEERLFLCDLCVNPLRPLRLIIDFSHMLDSGRIVSFKSIR